jgi:multiple sugar transport system permease protein
VRRRQKYTHLISYLFLFTSSFIMIFPVLYMALAAFTTPNRFMDTLMLPIPNTLNLDMMQVAWYTLQRAYLFTLARVGFYEFMTLLVGVLGGYIFSKLRFRGRNKIFLLLLSGMVMPSIIMIVPMYLMAARIPLAGGNDIWGSGGRGFIGEWPVLFLFGWVPPFAIFLLKQSLDMLPGEYEDAAKMDGAGILTIIFRVYLPLLKPPMVALIITTFLSIWNDYLWPSLTVYGNEKIYPISFAVAWVDNLRYWGGMMNIPGVMLGYLMAMWPPALVYFIFQRYFVQGMVASGLKG